MSKLNIAFLINPLHEMRHEDDTSFSLMAECDRRGHRLFCFESRDMTLNHNIPLALLTKCLTDPRQGVLPGRQIEKKLASLDAIIIRKEPPFNMDYLSATYLLDFVKNKTFTMNCPTGIRSNNEKISSLNFPLPCPHTIIGYGTSSMLKRAQSLGYRWVLKPLFDKGGKGIFQLNLPNRRAAALLKMASKNHTEPLALQRFIEHKSSGDKRILVLGGKAIGAFRRIPGPKDFRANMAVGGHAAFAEITPADRVVVRSIAGYLRKNGLHLAGIDLLKGKLTEINVTSPAGIPEINSFTGRHLEKTVVDYIEEQIRK